MRAVLAGDLLAPRISANVVDLFQTSKGRFAVLRTERASKTAETANCCGGSLGGSGRGSKNIQCGGQRDFCAGGAPPSLADLHGLANRYR